MHLLAKASAFLPEWELRRGVADCLKIPFAATKDLAQQLAKLPDTMRLWTERRHPVILILDEVLLMWLGNTLLLLKYDPENDCPFNHLVS
jgi:hypothetical protein